MNQTEFNEFFKVHSRNVDNSNSLGFWKLTDEIIETYLLDNMTKRDNVTVVDFGGGTGRWLLMLDKYFTNSKFIIVDLSADMMAQAKKKLNAGTYKNNVELMASDISAIKELKDNKADYIISTYNPLSFVNDPQLAINEAFRILKWGGRAMITVQGYYNALYSKVNNSLADHEELNLLFKDKKVQWNPSVPSLWQLAKSDMEKMFVNSGFKDISSYGIACVTQPQGEDFDPENSQLGSLSKKLNEDEAFYSTLLRIELNIGRNPDAVDRGMNIMTLGTK